MADPEQPSIEQPAAPPRPEPSMQRKEKGKKKKRGKKNFRNVNLIQAGQLTQFKKGVSGLMMKKGVKKATEDYLKLSLDYVVPDEWLVNGLEPLRGKKMTFGQVIAWRLLFGSVTGIRNPALNDLKYLLDRVLGRMPTTIKHGEAEPEDEFDGMTGEELIQMGLKIYESIQSKQKKQLPAKTEEVIDAEEVEDAPGPGPAPEGN